MVSYASFLRVFSGISSGNKVGVPAFLPYIPCHNLPDPLCASTSISHHLYGLGNPLRCFNYCFDLTDVECFMHLRKLRQLCKSIFVCSRREPSGDTVGVYLNTHRKLIIFIQYWVGVTKKSGCILYDGPSGFCCSDCTGIPTFDLLRNTVKFLFPTFFKFVSVFFGEFIGLFLGRRFFWWC